MAEKKSGASAKSAKAEAAKPNSAQQAFADYKKRMDENYRKAMAEKAPPGANPPQGQVYMPVPGFIPAPPGNPNPYPWHRQYPDIAAQGPNLLDQVGSLLNLGLGIVNVSLEGGLRLMERFYGMGGGYEESYCGGDYYGGCHHCGCGCGEHSHYHEHHHHCRSGVSSCGCC
ncbi:MAG TPA: hypothetical protein PKV71_16170 [Calditrichia bacterium]|nr:hypothetical protein [Calditrichia bacterium]